MGHVNSHNETPDAIVDKKNDLENSELKQDQIMTPPKDLEDGQVYNLQHISSLRKKIDFKEWIKEGEDLCKMLDEGAKLNKRE